MLEAFAYMQTLTERRGQHAATRAADRLTGAGQASLPATDADLDREIDARFKAAAAHPKTGTLSADELGGALWRSGLCTTATLEAAGVGMRRLAVSRGMAVSNEPPPPDRHHPIHRN